MGIATVILCGGKGTRAHPYTETVPKPLLEVGGQPVVRHVMQIYADQGFRQFVLAAGYKWRLVEDYATTLPSEWQVEVIDTGEDSATGERVRRVAGLVGSTFFVTYADGLGDVDLGQLIGFHGGHGGAATMTTVPLPSQYGTIEFDEAGRVSRFREKPRLPEHHINAGFFVLDRRAFDRWKGEDLELEVLPGLAAAGELFAYRHDGFWRSMDTHKDVLELSALCEGGDAPWMRRTTPASS